jgi:hypothetical protein
VALPAAAHAQRRVHVHVVTRQVQRDEALEDDAEAREGLREEDEQTRGCAAVRHHVQHGAELGRLLEAAGCVAVAGVEETGYAVEERACAWVEGHVIERRYGEDDARIACRVSASWSTYCRVTNRSGWG